ncbi:hypothetical protein [Vibrio sinaloensis]|uniref:hypothetical protein n=1 Tax=Photobacterium sp. (strain ATCC 43367) TaxID=379097 RepID=UPI00057ED4DB|nr:hypothetical protein [Vibrio sinaloensis]KHT40285.1 hypothetical protein RJ47_15175 [Vibrio sinaloensis]
MPIKMILLTALFSSVPTLAVASCQIDAFTLEPLSEKNQYNTLSTSPYTLSNSYKLAANVIGSDCSITVAVELEQGGQSLVKETNEALRFDWFGNGHRVGNRWLVTLSDEQPFETFQLRYPSLQWTSAGMYQAQLEASAVVEHSHTTSVAMFKTLPIFVEVLPIAKVQFYGLTQHHFNLDLGELTSHKIINSAPKLWVQTNTGFAISVSSRHHGVLRHETDDSRWDIEYKMLIDQKTIDLKQANASFSEPNPKSGMPMDIQFEVGDTNNKPGGRYTDTVEISIEPAL